MTARVASITQAGTGSSVSIAPWRGAATVKGGSEESARDQVFTGELI